MSANDLFFKLSNGALGELEERRKAYTKTFWKRFFLWWGITIPAVILLLVLAQDAPQLALIVGGVSLIGGSIWLGVIHSRFKKQFVRDFKSSVIPAVVKAVDDRLFYDANRGLMPEYHASALYPKRIDRQRAEDTISGVFGETHFSFGEIHTEYKTVTTDSKGRRQEHWHTIFQGLFFVGDFNKHFSGETIVDKDTMEKALGKLGRKFQSWNTERKGELIRMDNPAFEKQFAIYSTDEQECRYILSPSLMERILELNTRTGGAICLSFRNSNVYIAYTFKQNLFEPRIFSQSLKMEDVQLLMDLISLMSGIVEDLNLNTRIWTKA
jgi:hypothetical protein